MNFKLSLIGSILALGLLALAVAMPSQGVTRAQTAALTWYVDGNCKVCGAGTLDSPFRTISRALNSADDGDTILVTQGTYVEHLFIGTQVKLIGGYTATSLSWTRDITRYETIVTSDNPAVPGDWDGDWIGSPAVIKDGSTFRMWYSAGNEMKGERIGYADSPDGVNWFQPLSASLLEVGPLGAWDEAGVANPTVLTTGTGFQMWYVGLNNTGKRAIGYATSPDGLTWTKYDDNPVLYPDTSDGSSFDFPTVIQDGPGDYKMWYSGGRIIWLATSSDGLTWTKHLDAPALRSGTSGAWDEAQVYAPQVITGTDRYEMWYTAESWSNPKPQIGYAWSDDGVNWTTSPNNPVLSGTTNTWEEGEVIYPTVLKKNATAYQMWYRAGASGEQAFGQATSSDGIIWIKYGSNPVLSQGNPTQWGSSVVTLGDGSGEAVLDGLTITNGSAEYGGGIHLVGSTFPSIRNCTVTGNIARSSGGGMDIATGAPLIENTVVSSNASVAGWAGGIYVGHASPIISDSLITNNVAAIVGGGLVIRSDSQSTLIATTIVNNTASQGGGIFIDTDSALHIYNSRIDGNTASQEAGLRVRYSTLAMTNTFVLDNRATAGEAGAMSFWRSSGRLVNVTIAGNSATEGPGGIAFDTDCPNDSLVILNSILAFNGTDDINCSGGNCDITYSDVQEGLAGSGNISVDPKFVHRATGNYHLGMDSPAIDAGTGAGAPTADFEGDPRPPDAVDMGADEFVGDVIVIFLPLVLTDF
jgi:predicted GH43/DUF377 family glycosyl hydrolase